MVRTEGDVDRPLNKPQCIADLRVGLFLWCADVRMLRECVLVVITPWRIIRRGDERVNADSADRWIGVVNDDHSVVPERFGARHANPGLHH